MAGTDAATAYELEMEDLGVAVLAAAGPPVPLPSAGRVVQYNPSVDGSLSRWSFHWTNDVMGPTFAGVVTLPAGTWLAEVAGTTAAPAVYFVGVHMTYDQGLIEFPIVNPAA